MSYQSKSSRKFTATTITVAAVALAVAPVASATTFADVSPKYKEAIDFVVSKGAKGFSTTKFGVHENIIRQDAAVLLAQALGLEIDKTATKSEFIDVPARTAPYINALKEAGITSGKSATEFGSNDLITRGELAIWIQKGFNLKGKSDVKFTDVSPQYKDAVSALLENDITQGISSTQFGTDKPAKRGDYAIFLFKADQTLK